MFVAGPQLGFFVLRWIVLRFHWIGSLGFSSAQEEKKKVPKNTSPLTCGPDVLSWDVRRHAACGHKRETVILQNIWWFIKTLTDQITTHLNQRDCNTIFFLWPFCCHAPLTSPTEKTKQHKTSPCSVAHLFRWSTYDCGSIGATPTPDLTRKWRFQTQMTGFLCNA